MNRLTATFSLAAGQAAQIKGQMLNWVNQFGIFLFLDSNDYPDRYGRYDCMVAAGAASEIHSGNDAGKGLGALQAYTGGWLFGHISYDSKNLLEPRLSSRHIAQHQYPLFYFFCPEIVCTIARGGEALTIEAAGISPEIIYRQINECAPVVRAPLPELHFRQRMEREAYINTIGKLRRHIAEGDCYEVNFCSEGYCLDAAVDPLQVFAHLNHLSPAPFAACYRLNDRYMMCASPERYLQKAHDILRSQPIKGTARRDPDPEKDMAIRRALREDIKERAENIMIADLVRNDLARSCVPGSIKADELLGIYSYPQVHQMISTISGTMRPDVPFTDAIRHSFPMGSMTGAPKFRVMELIEQYETARRELFSGTVGYITPGQDFDFNVIIRSLFYNASDRYLSYQTGGAITYDSDPQKEWEERRLKAWALEKIFCPPGE